MIDATSASTATKDLNPTIYWSQIDQPNRYRLLCPSVGQTARVFVIAVSVAASTAGVAAHGEQQELSGIASVQRDLIHTRTSTQVRNAVIPITGSINSHAKYSSLEVKAQSTGDKVVPTLDVFENIWESFRTARAEDLEDAMDSQFESDLRRQIKAHGNEAIRAMANLIVGNLTNTTVSAHALKVLGRLHDSRTHMFRRWLLVRALGCRNAHLRDASGLGLASLDDPKAIPAVREALLSESIPMVREGLELVLEQLTETSRGSISS